MFISQQPSMTASTPLTSSSNYKNTAAVTVKGLPSSMISSLPSTTRSRQSTELNSSFSSSSYYQNTHHNNRFASDNQQTIFLNRTVIDLNTSQDQIHLAPRQVSRSSSAQRRIFTSQPTSFRAEQQSTAMPIKPSSNSHLTPVAVVDLRRKAPFTQQFQHPQQRIPSTSQSRSSRLPTHQDQSSPPLILSQLKHQQSQNQQQLPVSSNRLPLHAIPQPRDPLIAHCKISLENSTIGTQSTHVPQALVAAAPIAVISRTNSISSRPITTSSHNNHYFHHNNSHSSANQLNLSITSNDLSLSQSQQNHRIISIDPSKYYHQSNQSSSLVHSRQYSSAATATLPHGLNSSTGIPAALRSPSQRFIISSNMVSTNQSSSMTTANSFCENQPPSTNNNNNNQQSLKQLLQPLQAPKKMETLPTQMAIIPSPKSSPSSMSSQQVAAFTALQKQQTSLKPFTQEFVAKTCPTVMDVNVQHQQRNQLQREILPLERGFQSKNSRPLEPIDIIPLCQQQLPQQQHKNTTSSRSPIFPPKSSPSTLQNNSIIKGATSTTSPISSSRSTTTEGTTSSILSRSGFMKMMTFELSQQPLENSNPIQTTSGSFILFYPFACMYEGTIDQLTKSRINKGKFTFSNGFSAEGQWLDNQLDGNAIITSSTGTVIFEGTFHKNRLNGKGISYESNYSHNPLNQLNLMSPEIRYEGEFQDNERNGFGILSFENKDQFYGEFVDDQITGVGTYKQHKGLIQHGQWKNGVLICSIPI